VVKLKIARNRTFDDGVNWIAEKEAEVHEPKRDARAPRREAEAHLRKTKVKGRLHTLTKMLEVGERGEDHGR